MENNKLIAEFMNVDYVDVDTYLQNNKELHYHTSWDWLMPVVIKIGGSSNLYGAMKKLRPYGVLRTIEDTHQAVVEFINQLNNNNNE